MITVRLHAADGRGNKVTRDKHKEESLAKREKKETGADGPYLAVRGRLV